MTPAIAEQKYIAAKIYQVEMKDIEKYSLFNTALVYKKRLRSAKQYLACYLSKTGFSQRSIAKELKLNLSTVHQFLK